MGYRFLAQSVSQQTHDIPIGFELANGDYRRLVADIEQFVNLSHHAQGMPLFYAQVMSTLN